MIETMDKQQANFANKMREYDLSHETDLRFSSPKVDVCLYDNDAPFSPLESKLEAVLGPPLTTSPLVAPSSTSTSKDNTLLIMTFPDPPFPLVDGVRGR